MWPSGARTADRGVQPVLLYRAWAPSVQQWGPGTWQEGGLCCFIGGSVCTHEGEPQVDRTLKTDPLHLHLLSWSSTVQIPLSPLPEALLGSFPSLSSAGFSYCWGAKWGVKLCLSLQYRYPGASLQCCYSASSPFPPEAAAAAWAQGHRVQDREQWGKGGLVNMSWKVLGCSDWWSQVMAFKLWGPPVHYLEWLKDSMNYQECSSESAAVVDSSCNSPIYTTLWVLGHIR